MNWNQRFSHVPWISTHDDLEEGRRFAWEVEYQRDRDRATCVCIADPFLNVHQSYLVIHAVRGNGNDGGTITLAISETPLYDVYAQETFKLNHRAQGDGDHGP